jgi:hypothetical protein
LALHAALRTRLDQTIEVWPYAGTNLAGGKLFSSSAAVMYMAREEAKQHEVVDPQGKRVLARGRIFVGPTSTGGAPSVSVTDRLFPPGSTTPLPLLAVETLRDRTGVHHQVVSHG